MKAIFKSNDIKEIKRIAKADDMASFIWELQHNILFDCKDYKSLVERIREELYEINIDELWE